jgi:hemoglobin
MELKIVDAPFGFRPRIVMPSPEIYKRIGEEGVRKLIHDHYALLRKSDINHLFPQDDKAFEQAEKNSADFFVQMLGGPQHYFENRGRPMMAKRHAAFKIQPKSRKTWLRCYQEILPKLDLPEELIKTFWDYLNLFSLWMVNTPADAENGIKEISL